MFCPATFIWLVNRRDNSIDVFSMSNTYTTYLRYLAHYCFCVCVSVDVLRALPLNGLGEKKTIDGTNEQQQQHQQWK